MATQRWLGLGFVMVAAACSKNSQAPDGEALVQRAEPGAAVLVGEQERGAAPPGGQATMPTRVPSTIGAAPGPMPPGAVDGVAAFAARCSGCHGTTGRGDGMMAVAFAVKPRSFADAAWQAAVSDIQIATAIVGGSAAVGKSSVMPA